MAERNLSGRRLGEYLLGTRIDSGGYGVVYSAEQVPLRRQCVVKVLLEERYYNSNHAHLRFQREAELASRLDHPYAARVLTCGSERDIDTNGTIVWIAMERAQGITLDDWLAKNGPMSLERFVPFFQALCEVVQHAHDLGIVHRDIKPSNIMVSERAGRILPKLLDLGIAKPVLAELAEELKASRHKKPSRTPRTVPMRANARPQTNTWRSSQASSSSRRRAKSREKRWRLTTPGSRMGSWPYMPPEQWVDSPDLGPAADLYALGVVAYELLTGSVPFTGDHADEFYQAHENMEAPPIGSALLDPILARALAKTPAGRQASVKDLADEFSAALRAMEREHLRSAAQTWSDRNRSSRLLWNKGMLADYERMSAHNARILTDLEYEFLEASQRQATRLERLLWACVALAIIGVVGVFCYRAYNKSLLADVTTTQAELDKGRDALLHGEPEATALLSSAYQHAPTASTAFMLARAIQHDSAAEAQLPSIKGRTWSAVFSTDGKYLLTADDAAAQVWDATTHHLLFTLPHPASVYQASFSKDGTHIYTAGGDSIVRVWSASNGALVRELKHDGKRLLYGAIDSKDDLIAAIDGTGEVTHVWNLTTGTVLAELNNAQATGFYSVAFSSDGHFLATSGGNDVRVFDSQTWSEIQRIPGPGIHSLSWDPTGARLLTGSISGASSIWALPDGTRMHLQDVGSPIDAVAFSPNGMLVATAGRDGSEQVWNAKTGSLQSQGNQLHDKIFSIEFDATSKLVVASDATGSVMVSDSAEAMPLSLLTGSSSAVLSAHFSPDSRRVIGASEDGAWVWDATSTYRRWSTTAINEDCGYMTNLESDKRFLAIGCRGHATRIWDTDRYRMVAELPPITQVEGDFASAYPAVSASGDRAAIARGNTVQIYELPSGNLLHTVVHTAQVNAVAFARTGRDLASGATDGSLLVTRDNGAQLTLPSATSGVDAVAQLPDGRVIACDAGRHLRIYDDHGNVLAVLEMQVRARLMRLSPTAHRLLTIPSLLGKAASPELWDLDHYRRIGELVGGKRQSRVYSARFVGDDEILAAYSDGTVRSWDGANGRFRQMYRGGARFLADATKSPDGSRVIAGGADGLLRFWDSASGRLLWTLPAHNSAIIGIRIDGDEIVSHGFAGDVARWKLPDLKDVFAACSEQRRCAIMVR